MAFPPESVLPEYHHAGDFSGGVIIGRDLLEIAF
jgi:hypothetical protein